MNWILIVMLAGNIHFAKVMDGESSCTKLGDVFALDGASYMCIDAKTIQEALTKE